MNPDPRTQADEFLAISGQFHLGSLVTESPHPVTANLSEVAKTSIPGALRLLFEVDRDVLRAYRKWVKTDAPARIAATVLETLRRGGRVFFTGCGSTGRLSILLESIWRGFWQDRGEAGWEDRVRSVMAGGDFALIKSVEGFEDFTALGERQIADVGVAAGDVVFAITEGGETSFVIGTAWKALELGAKVYFVYNNPDQILRETVERSRRVIDEPRIAKINLTTGPMAITGSTRMQATTIQLCVLMTVLEIVARELCPPRPRFDVVPAMFAEGLERAHAALCCDEAVEQLARLVSVEESVYRTGGRVNYFADTFAIDVLTDTTERSPTFCTPPFRRFDDKTASESWAFLFMPYCDTPTAWERLLRRKPRAIAWTEDEIAEMIGRERAARQAEIVRRISLEDVYAFRIGLDGLPQREHRPGDGAVGLGSDAELAHGFIPDRLQAAADAGAATDVIRLDPPTGELLLDGITRVGLKMMLNALSTCTMVRLGRVMGNYMTYVVPSNLKLIDRAARYIQGLTGLGYEDAVYLLFEVMDYVAPRMRADREYPPVVALAVARARYGLPNEEAESRLADATMR